MTQTLSKQPRNPSINPEGWIPITWRYLVSDLTDYVANGSFAELRKRVMYLSEPNYARLVRLTDIRNGMKSDGAAYISKDAYDFLAKSRLKGGEFLIASVGAYSGLVVRCPQLDRPGSLGPNMMMASFRSDRSDPQFMFWAASSEYIRDQLKLRAQQSSAQPKLNKEDFRSVRMLLPPLPTQKAIANFLDRKTAAIDALIEKKEKLLELLAEKRSALINQAVTKGLDPNVPMKDSGIPWIGEVPEHWAITRASRLCSGITKGATPSAQAKAAERDFPVPFLRVNNLNFDGTMDLGELRFIQESIHNGELGRSKVKPGDILVNIVGPPLGKVAVVPDSLPDSNINQAIAFYRCKKVGPDFFTYWLQSDFVKSWFWLNAKKTSGQANLTLELCRELPVLLPPRHVQRDLSQRLRSKIERGEGAAECLRKQLLTLKEYRQSLITATVTGQLEIPAEDYEATPTEDRPS